MARNRANGWFYIDLNKLDLSPVITPELEKRVENQAKAAAAANRQVSSLTKKVAVLRKKNTELAIKLRECQRSNLPNTPIPNVSEYEVVLRKKYSG